MAAKDAPKTEIEKPAEPKPVTFDHPGKRVFVLVPADSKERDIVLKHLEDELFPQLERLPTVTHDLRLNRFRGDEVVYVAHPMDARVKGADGRFGQGAIVYVSAPVATDGFLSSDGEGFTTLAPESVVAAICTLVRGSREGRCYTLRVSEDFVAKIVNY